ncbi:hypothetical protein [Persicobacter diffluens]|uniref:Uncharacterized protein n=1 Tax=Persicobacter diffluens TaxID=981 RepID=A0AAN4W4J2_9BACT|nr:hypothetical protein PEDI_56900 [Persicobacter diffluens]
MNSSLYQYINKLAATATSQEEVFGLLFSQIGYHPDRPIKVILRLPAAYEFEQGAVIWSASNLIQLMNKTGSNGEMYGGAVVDRHF